MTRSWQTKLIHPEIVLPEGYESLATPIYRANVSLRGIALPKGQHTVRFWYAPAPFFRGLWITVIALSALLIWFGAAAYRVYWPA